MPKKSSQKVEPIQVDPVELIQQVAPVELVQEVDPVEPVPGFVINNKIIDSISGPTSFYYLRPTQQVYSDGNGKYFPLVVLFGDYHRSEDNYCSSCNCSLERKYCCYKLSDPSFLRSIDELASTYTIDFYTETFFEGTGEGFKGGMMEDMTTGNMITCYNRDLRGTLEDRCPTKNIRWQAGDVRLAGTSLHDLYGIKNTKFIKSEKYLKNSYIESQLSSIINLIVNFFNQSINYGNFELELAVLTELHGIITESAFGTLEIFQDVLLSLFDDDKFDFNKFSKTIFQAFDKDNSVIYKQVLKQTYGNFADIEQWSDFYARSLNFVFTDITGIQVSTLKLIISNLDKYLRQEIKISLLDYSLFNIFSTRILAGLVDVYFIARMFKQPTDGNRSDLTFSYFGDYHILNIKDLLLSTGAYELVVSKNVNNKPFSNKEDRCLYFTNKRVGFFGLIDMKGGDNVNLDKELRKHKLT